MAIPTYVGAGVVFNSTGAGNVAWPSGHAADDIGVLIVETANQAVATPAGWTIAAVAQGTGTAGTAGATGIATFWKLATSSAEADVALADTGDHQFARIIAIRGCHIAATPVNATGGDVQAGADTSVEIPGLTTTAPDCLVLALVANAADVSGGQVSGVANASLTGVVNQLQQQSTLGNGGGFAVIVGGKATAGAVSTTTGTLATSSAQARVSIALKAPDAGTAAFGGIYVATGVKQTAGVVGASTGTFYVAAVHGMMTIALKPPTPAANTAPVIAAIPNLFAAVEDLLSYPVSATDPEGDALTYSLLPGSTALPGGLSIGSSDGIIEWTPIFFQQGVWNVTVRATDTGGLFDEQTFDITVTGGTATAIEVANRAAADLAAAEALIVLLLAQQQMNANVITQAQALHADLQVSSDYMADVVADITAAG